MADKQWFLGLDGGGTKTTAVLALADGAAIRKIKAGAQITTRKRAQNHKSERTQNWKCIICPCNDYKTVDMTSNIIGLCRIV